MAAPLRLLTLALLISSTFGLTDCKKNSEPEPDKRSQREIWLTTPGWNMQSITDVWTTVAGVTTTYVNPAAAYFQPCALDDLRYYNSDRSFTIDDGPIKCQPPQVINLTWDFAANETEIIVDSKSAKITTLTATDLALEYTETYSDGATLVQTQTFVAK